MHRKRQIRIVYPVNQSEPLDIDESKLHSLGAFLSLQMVYDCKETIFAQKRRIRTVYPVNQLEPLSISQSKHSSLRASKSYQGLYIV